MALTVPVNGSLNAAGLAQAAIQQTTSYTTNGFNCDVTQTQFPLQLGVPLQNNYTYNVIPAELNFECVSATNTYSSASGFFLPLKTTVTYADSSSTSVQVVSRIVQYNGSSAVQFDCERPLLITFSASTIACTITVQALDYRGVPMTMQKYVAGTSVTSALFTNPVSTIISIYFSNAPFSSGTIQAGNNDWIGLPYFLASTNLVQSCNWAGKPLRASTYTDQGEFRGIVVGNAWRSISATNLASSSYMSGINSNNNTGYMSNPTRGVVELNAGGTETAPDGDAPFSITYFVYGSDSETDANLQNLNYSALGLYSVKGVTSSSADTVSYAWPYITRGDLTGLQWNAASITNGTLPTYAFSSTSGDVPILASYAATLAQLAI